AQSRARAGAASARLADLSAQETQLQARIGRNRGELIRLLGALERWRAQPPPALLVSPQRAVDAARGALLMRAVTPELQRRATALAARARALQAVRRRAALAGAALFAAESDAADRQEAVDAVAARKMALDAALLTPEERAAGASARAAAGAPDPSASAAAPPPERLLAPVEGAPALGWGAPWAGHGEAEGLVWRPAAGAAVRAPAAGVVEYAGPLKGARLVLILRLAGDWRLVLTGLQTLTVGVGAEVAAGAPVGRAPPAGAPDADLYLQLRDGARAVDPTARLSPRRS
ncbi:MAG: peptidoglycan DD-metalloendopeptidase family protein, partial [Caulobacteraceae bacterium]|nr:peptidoglycan DD-metalloendopeptidase family protein [Caulobacter sp.]